MASDPEIPLTEAEATAVFERFKRNARKIATADAHDDEPLRTVDRFDASDAFDADGIPRDTRQAAKAVRHLNGRKPTR